MATNPYINRVDIQRGGTTETLINIGDTTAVASDVASGKSFYLASGEKATGTLDKASGSVYQDADGYLVVDDSESSAPQGNISITSNGTYDVADYAGASVAIPVGMTKTDLKNYIQRSSSFTDIDWPENMQKIGANAFANFPYFNPSSLPSTITLIDLEAFKNCVRLALTSLPSGITVIGQSAFQGCQRLALTSLPSGITVISSYAFDGCYNLALSGLPSGVSAIAGYAFQDCYNLAFTSLPSSMTSIQVAAFQRCESILSISCDGVITTLGINAFVGNSTHPMRLTSASFPNMALTSNISYSFGSSTAAMACQLLEFCDIGSTVGIASSAFANCYALETLVLRKTASVCTLANVSAFTNTPMRGYGGKTGTVYVPSALISSYQTATNWSTLYNDGTVTFSAIEGSDYELE